MACIPIIFGFPTKIKQDAPEQGRLCPRCNNAAVVGAESRTWFEFFWIPLIPFSKKHIWLCSICNWQMKKGDGHDPQVPGGGFNPGGGYPQQGGYQQQQQHQQYPPQQYMGNPPPPPQRYGGK